MPTVVSPDGVALHVEIDPRGQVDPNTQVDASGAGVPVTVLLAHGWTLDTRSWGPVTRALRERDAAVRVVRYDHRGHGRSAPVDPGTMTIAHLADDLAAVIAAVAPHGPLVLGGHSMGGMTIMALAEQHPEVFDRVAGIALVATASGGVAQPTFGMWKRQAELVRRAEQRMYSSPGWAGRTSLGRPRLLAPAMRWLLLGPRPGAEAVRITTEAVAGCRPLTVSGFRPTLAAHDRDAALALFASIPTAVLVGTRDRLTPLPAARRIVAALPSAALTIFPEAGHMLPVERVSGVADRIAALTATAP